MKSLLLWSIVITVIGSLFLSVQLYRLDRDISSLLIRAQVAADASDMAEYMSKLELNLQTHNLTTGHYALLWKTPENDLELLHKSVKQIRERLILISNEPKSSTTYQVALDDIRGTIREIPSPVAGVMWVRYWWLWVIIVPTCTITVFGILIWLGETFT